MKNTLIKRTVRTEYIHDDYKGGLDAHSRTVEWRTAELLDITKEDVIELCGDITPTMVVIETMTHWGGAKADVIKAYSCSDIYVYWTYSTKEELKRITSQQKIIEKALLKCKGKLVENYPEDS